jgi:ABC-type branched-subunit amino acid transport system ATPase component
MGIVERRRGSVTFDGRETIGLPSDVIARQGLAYCPEERGIFSSLNVEENMLLPPQVKAGGMSLTRSTALPQPQGAPPQPGHQAVGRRAADAGDRPHPAHRRQPAACSTSRPRASPR